MPGTHTLRNLYNRLKPDEWRRKPENSVSDDVALVNRILFDPFASESQCREALSRWMQRHQPCLFGRIAAARNWIHYCLLNDRDFREKDDEEISAKIRTELVAWKRRSIRPTADFATPAHGFLLAASSERLTMAAPDEHLLEFAEKLQELWGCSATRESSGTVHWETLYLENPANGSLIRFTFGVDFFGTQGDRRWWHDHRVPGGLAFTANSVGHMKKYRQWYQGMKEQDDWVLQTAMLTISLAADTSYGKATWLKPLGKDGRPLIRDLKCPFSDLHNLKPELQGKDWTRYGGFLHTDHSIRPEFFHDNAEPLPDLTQVEYLQDFTYLYDQSARDYLRFVEGVRVSEQEVTEVIGTPDSWQTIAGPSRKTRAPEVQTEEARRHQRDLKELLLRCTDWNLSRSELNYLTGQLNLSK
jgi:hypothetical protein